MRIVVWTNNRLYAEALVEALGATLADAGPADLLIVAGPDGEERARTFEGRVISLVGRIAPHAELADPAEGLAGLRRKVRMVREPVATYGKAVELTPRERQAAAMIAAGRSNAEIGETLGLRDQSVRNLVRTIVGKLGCDNRVQAALRLREYET